MAVDIHAPYQVRTQQALVDAHLRTAVNRATTRLGGARVQAMGAVDGQQLREQVRQMKTWTLRHLPDLLEQFERHVTENGGHMHWARDGAEANQIVLDIARRNQVKKVVKSKSMATEETHLNAALEGADIKVIETDLGEYIIQLAGEPPSHIVAPVIHKRLEDISELFQQELNMPETLDPEIICATARRQLREDFLSAEMGISGGNFGIAETGTLCIVTNEGNGRMVSSIPRIYVALMGLEKIVPTVEDALLQYQALCRSATGQPFSVYLSMTSGPRREGEPDGPSEFHVILMDNGRTRMLERGYGEVMLCIRCGACLNVCPVYRQVGGHTYGAPYSGPIGAVVMPLLADEITHAKELPHASTLCGACRDACPVQINLPRMLLELRRDLREAGAVSHAEEMSMKGFVQMMSSRRAYELGGKTASTLSNLYARLSGGTIKQMPGPFSGWTNSRDFPPFAQKSFRQQWAERKK